MNTEQAFRPTCPLCGAFTRNYDDGCWSCTRCGTTGDTGQHRGYHRCHCGHQRGLS